MGSLASVADDTKCFMMVKRSKIAPLDGINGSKVIVSPNAAFAVLFREVAGI